MAHSLQLELSRPPSIESVDWADSHRYEIDILPYGFNASLGPEVNMWILRQLPPGLRKMRQGMKVHAQYGVSQLDGHLGGAREMGPAMGGYILFDVVGGGRRNDRPPQFLYVWREWVLFPVTESTHTLRGVEIVFRPRVPDRIRLDEPEKPRGHKKGSVAWLWAYVRGQRRLGYH
ncbi:hypothetical protein BV25DRAFT_1913049 [Artomyces pyxidatus]|uniref:Uncharacterized protein n=1 Tax=Artomyces pyxidatus TaxID=48021 RepID=A0ACB8TCF0_9AGAM|nr:hypothetical protein BV25DRAFT_1913049 [Artomyces pyxidatus]